MISELYPIVGTGLLNSGWSVSLKKITVLPDLESPPITILIWSGLSEHIRQPIDFYYNLFNISLTKVFISNILSSRYNKLGIEINLSSVTSNAPYFIL